jgi:hypothetical protein
MNKFEFFVVLAFLFNILARVSNNWVSVAFFCFSFLYIVFAFISVVKTAKKSI